MFLSAVHSRHSKTSRRRKNSISISQSPEVEPVGAEVDELFVSNCRCGLCVSAFESVRSCLDLNIFVCEG